MIIHFCKVQYIRHEHCQDVLQIKLNVARLTNFYFFKVFTFFKVNVLIFSHKRL